MESRDNNTELEQDRGGGAAEASARRSRLLCRGGWILLQALLGGTGWLSCLACVLQEQTQSCNP